MSDLSPIASESQDVVFSANAIAFVDDIVATFREVYRVLKTDGLFVLTAGHPFAAIIDPKTLLPERSYHDTGKVVGGLEVSDEPGFAYADNYRKVSDYYNTLVDAGFRVERIMEPDVRPVDPDDPRSKEWGQETKYREMFPQAVIFKCRKVKDGRS